MLLRKDGNSLMFPWASEGGWAACETCSALIEADDWDGLAQHSADTSPILLRMQDALVKGEVKKAIMKLHAQFRKRRGERVPSYPGDPDQHKL